MRSPRRAVSGSGLPLPEQAVVAAVSSPWSVLAALWNTQSCQSRNRVLDLAGLFDD
ncbi:MAG: hypothetical protein ACTII7_12055 [Galactobacter sp.]